MTNEISYDIHYQSNINNADNLEYKLASIQNKNGVITSIWDDFKSCTGLGTSSKKCEATIEAYKNGEISYEEANSILNSYEQKQSDSLNLFSNIATSIFSTLALGSVVLTGGLSAGVLIGAGCAGGAFKTGFKMLDRATNNTKGDALDKEEITKDFLTGALDGAVSVGTMGLNVTPVNFEMTASNTLKQTVALGVKQGAKSGAVSGALTGGGDYAIYALVDDDIEFNFDEFLRTTASTALFSSLIGGTVGGLSNAHTYNKNSRILIKRQAQFEELDLNSIAKLSDMSKDMSKSYKFNNDRVLKENQDIFKDVDSVMAVTARTKGDNSVFAKLAKARLNGDLDDISQSACYDVIRDAYGSRIQLACLTKEEAQEQIDKYLANSGYTYDDFIKYISGDTDSLSENACGYFELNSKSIYNNLKEMQTDKVVQRLESAIRNKEIRIKQIENYGDETTSYFTKAQLDRLAYAYKETYDQPLVVTSKVSCCEFDPAKGTIFGDNSNIIFESDDMICLNSKNAVKNSGYVSAQIDVEYDFADGSTGYGELQIRGVEVNPFADVEHIPYDIKSNKITEYDKAYKQMYDLIKDMPNEQFKDYNRYLTDVYKNYRALELGLPVSAEPALPSYFSTDAVKLLTKEGLFEFKKNLSKFSIIDTILKN